jgi:hypothetical protein
VSIYLLGEFPSFIPCCGDLDSVGSITFWTGRIRIIFPDADPAPNADPIPGVHPAPDAETTPDANPSPGSAPDPDPNFCNDDAGLT